MRFDKDAILNIDIKELSKRDREMLAEKFFGSDVIPPWKEKLQTLKSWLRREQAHKELWRAYTGECKPAGNGESFRCDHDMLLRRALYRRPVVTGNRATDFSKWVLSLYWDISNRAGLTHGKEVERNVAKLATVSTHTDWELIYRDPLDEKPTPLIISSLTVNGKPLWGAPDVVYRKKTTGEVLIVERKATNRPIPSNGWPNLRAQLWAYAHIDDWRDAPRIVLVGEVWGFHHSRIGRRKVLRWVHGEKQFARENAELFELYCGPHP